MPLVSVIIPAFNAEATIRETVASVLAQTLVDFELIIINSATAKNREKTQKIIQNFNDHRIRVIDCEEANVSVNRNRGINQVSSPLIAFLDADDLWHPEKLEQQYTALQENPDAAIAYSATECIDEQSNFIRPGPAALWEGDVYSQLLVFNFLVSGSNIMVRTEAIKSVGYFDESLPNSQDYDMWLRLAEQYHYMPVNQVHILYRVSTQSLSFNVARAEALNLKIFERAFSSPKGQIFKQLRPYCLANLYKYLTSKCLESAPQNQKPSQIIRLLLRAIYWDPSLIWKPIMAKIIIKVAILLIFPRAWSSSLLQKVSRWTDTTTLLGYLVQPDALPTFAVK